MSNVVNIYKHSSHTPKLLGSSTIFRSLSGLEIKMFEKHCSRSVMVSLIGQSSWVMGWGWGCR